MELLLEWCQHLLLMDVDIRLWLVSSGDGACSCCHILQETHTQTVNTMLDFFILFVECSLPACGWTFACVWSGCLLSRCCWKWQGIWRFAVAQIGQMCTTDHQRHFQKVAMKQNEGAHQCVYAAGSISCTDTPVEKQMNPFDIKWFIYIKAYVCPLEAYSFNFYYTQTYMPLKEPISLISS